MPPQTEPLLVSVFYVLCTKYSGVSAGMTIYEDSLRTNIIGEFSLKEFLKENHVRSPVVQTTYAEVQEINRVSYRSLHTGPSSALRHRTSGG